MELDLASGKLVARGGAKDDLEIVKADLTLQLDLVKVLKLVAEKIPGTIDDAIIGVVVAAVEAAKQETKV